MMPIHLLQDLGVEPCFERWHILAWRCSCDGGVISPFDDREIRDLIVVALISDPLRLQEVDRKEMMTFETAPYPRIAGSISSRTL